MLDGLNSLKVIVLIEDTVPYESNLLAAHGISFYLEAKNESTTMRVLFDVGQSPDALISNMQKLGVEPESIDAIVLSHCHYDHTRGLVKIVEVIGKKELPIIAHPSIFRLNFVTRPFLRHVGMDLLDARERVESAGGRLFLTSDPLELMNGLMTTGEVERQTDFEDVGIELKSISNGRIVEDKMLDDISLVAGVKGKGIVILTGCSHAGIVNIVKQSVKLAGVDKIAGIMGGFHLIEASDDRITKTVGSLKGFDISMISAGHCTGRRAQHELKVAFGGKWKDMGSGVVYEF